MLMISLLLIKNKSYFKLNPKDLFCTFCHIGSNSEPDETVVVVSCACEQRERVGCPCVYNFHRVTCKENGITIILAVTEEKWNDK